MIGKRQTLPTEVDYAWVDSWPEASPDFCVVMVRGLAPEEVLTRMLPNAPIGIVSVSEARRWAEAQSLPNYGTSVEAVGLGGWSLAVEVNGYHATLEHVISRLAKGGAAATIYTGFNGPKPSNWHVGTTPRHASHSFSMY
jgi:hypothetical protein